MTFRTRTLEESLQCSERFAAHLGDAVAKGALKPAQTNGLRVHRRAPI